MAILEAAVRVAAPRRRVRVLVLSEYAAGALGAWAREQTRRGAGLLFDRPPQTRGGLRPLARQALTTSAVREVVRRAAEVAYPLPAQRRIRRRLRARGLVDLFRVRLVSSWLPLDLVVELVGVDRISHLHRYARRPVTLARLHREWRRLTARWRWI